MCLAAMSLGVVDYGLLTQDSYKWKQWYVICLECSLSWYKFESSLRTPLAPFTNVDLISAWINNYIHHKVWNKITYPFLNLNAATAHIYHSLCSSHRLRLKLIHFSKGVPWNHICHSTIRCVVTVCIKTLMPRQKDRHLANGIFECILFNNNYGISVEMFQGSSCDLISIGC